MRKALLILALGGLGWLALAGVTRPILSSGTAPAATCILGELFLDTDETVDTNCTTTLDNAICACVATNTWADTKGL